ncbi:VOC family protein [Amycolatopsis jiangsuensis]|uniref:Putative enzyme related to lactoylglutathione lyase n=1 Tax=Amycolatopsis jiangsuensis TaxID=1181879 RepID=A0A840J4L6_9PSEU|nr:putative enzyme related to lactoylglutathione lyase [Amycolatopsis jiangsuensis]
MDCLFRGVPVAGLTRGGTAGWTIYLATDDCDRSAEAVVAAGGVVEVQPHERGDRGRAALVVDPTGARFGLWQGRTLPGCRLVNEPGTLMRNDLITPDPEPAREFYRTVFGFTLDGNEDLPGIDFTFLRRPDGHEIGGVTGNPQAVSGWGTLFLADDADAAAARGAGIGGVVVAAEDTPYGRVVTVRDPFGTEFALGS